MANKGKVTEKDNGWTSFKKILQKIPDKKLVVGIPGPIDFSVPTIGAIGTAHEFGTSQVEDRSFLRSTFDKNRLRYTRSLAQQVRRALERGEDPAAGLFKLGEKVRKDVINAIRNREIRQEIAESTKKAFIAPGSKTRRGDQPALINSGRLVGSIVAKVVPR